MRELRKRDLRFAVLPLWWCAACLCPVSDRFRYEASLERDCTDIRWLENIISAALPCPWHQPSANVHYEPTRSNVALHRLALRTPLSPPRILLIYFMLFITSAEFIVNLFNSCICFPGASVRDTSLERWSCRRRYWRLWVWTTRML